jgi:three-Cys-motif partner protein
MKKNLWDITNRPSTKTKLEILEKVFDMWLTIWNKQDWVSNEWYVVDLFAGKGKYIDNGKEVNGSPLIFLEKVSEKINRLKQELKIKLFLVEKKKSYFNALKKNIENFVRNSPQIKDKVKIEYFQKDCNVIIENILSKITDDRKYPIFVLVDPSGLQIKRNTINRIVDLQNPKDVMFNYILEGVRRTGGVAKKAHRGERLSIREIKTVETLKKFIGKDVRLKSKSERETLIDYCNVFTSKNLKVVAYDIEYPDRKDILYYLLFATKNLNIANIVKDIYAKQKEKRLGPSLFGGKEFYINQILMIKSNVSGIKRKSLLYETKVEYGNWTINHIVGCKHGCKFPCYAMMMAKKFGWVKDYRDWRKPKIVENALELLEKEIPKYKNKIDFVHLCFMSDPFMYNFDKKSLIPEIKELTLKIIERLNKDGIKVTTLTKGIYPDEIIDREKFLENNEYGVTLVSLNKEFKNKFEPFSAPYERRLASLKKLSDNGLKTWVSMEPYPTPELDITAEDIDKILEEVSFVNKLIFGKFNYRKIVPTKKTLSVWKNNKEFYEEMVKKVIDFCEKNDIKYHIKFGTPLSKGLTTNIFKD